MSNDIEKRSTTDVVDLAAQKIGDFLKDKFFIR